VKIAFISLAIGGVVGICVPTLVIERLTRETPFEDVQPVLNSDDSTFKLFVVLLLLFLPSCVLLWLNPTHSSLLLDLD